jgi:succinate-semialdehyde dehydrogenase/glutarate-semialdehyde dehydrogenase
MPKVLKSINPYNSETIAEYESHGEALVDIKIELADKAFTKWRDTPLLERLAYFRKLQSVINEEKSTLARLATLEMGKLIVEAVAEVEKCANTISFYLDKAEELLADETANVKARKAFISYQPLGVVLGVMPWNFPYWQVLRFAIPTMIAGNTIVLKHASNVSGCALAIEELFKKAGFPEGAFQTILVPGGDVARVISLPEIKAVSLTGSTTAGKSVAMNAGKYIKKCVLELGGNDPYIVLKDADVKKAADICAKSRLQNAGQSCVAAKRFIVDASIYDDFLEQFTAHFKSRVAGDPLDSATSIAPLVSGRAAEDAHKQVLSALKVGAQKLFGDDFVSGNGAFYPPAILADVKHSNNSFDDEIFAPVASVIKFTDENEAIEIANNSIYGLGAAIFSEDLKRAETIAKYKIEAGMVFINDMVRSDAAIPFGGVKESGYGRELSKFGIHEFTNIKTILVN